MTYLEFLKDRKASFKRDKSTGEYISNYKDKITDKSYSMEITPNYDGDGVYYNIYDNTNGFPSIIDTYGHIDFTVRESKEAFVEFIKDREAGKEIERYY